MTDKTKKAEKQPAEPAAEKDDNKFKELKAEAFSIYNKLVDIQKQCDKRREDDNFQNLGDSVDDGVEALRSGLLSRFADIKFQIPTDK